MRASCYTYYHYLQPLEVYTYFLAVPFSIVDKWALISLIDVNRDIIKNSFEPHQSNKGNHIG